MKRNLIAVLSIFTVAGFVSWKLANQETVTVGLKDVSVIKGSEHAHPGPGHELAGIRIRLSPSDFGLEITAPTQAVPQISLAAE
jgi:hypothetical protein